MAELHGLLKLRWWLVHALALTATASALIGCNSTRRADRFLIPAGYVGWVCIEYYVQGAPALPTKGHYNIIDVPRNGRVKTSTIPQSGEAMDEYLYVNQGNQRCIDNCGGQTGMIWGRKLIGVPSRRTGDTLVVAGNPNKLIFFVGIKQQYQQFGMHQSDGRTIGPIDPARLSTTTK